MSYKPKIRKRIRAERRHLNKNFIEQAAKYAAEQIIFLKKFIESKTIAFYLPQENEFDTHFIMQCASDLNKTLYLPVVSSDNSNKILLFYSYHPGDALQKNHFDISEPDIKNQKKIDCAALDIIFLPLVAFDVDCNRLGRGVGYYDHTLEFIKTTAGKRPALIGLAYEFQKIPVIETKPWDVPMDYVITEEKIYQR